VLIKNDRSPAMFPIVNPYGHVVMQAQRGDVHTVLVDGQVLKYDGALIGIDLAPVKAAIADTVEYLQATLGAEAWQQGMNPDIPPKEEFDNPYQYSDYSQSESQG
jgi:5-methylthioadenosine/S-adenosylhomocysteine deaminase